MFTFHKETYFVPVPLLVLALVFEKIGNTFYFLKYLTKIQVNMYIY